MAAVPDSNTGSLARWQPLADAIESKIFCDLFSRPGV
jgi:hypothetical protein